MKLDNVPASQNVVDLRTSTETMPALDSGYVSVYTSSQFLVDAVSVFAMLSGVAAICALLLYICVFVGRKIHD